MTGGAELVQQVFLRAESRCEYCRMPRLALPLTQLLPIQDPAFGTFGLEGIPRKCYGIGSNFSAFCRPELAE